MLFPYFKDGKLGCGLDIYSLHSIPWPYPVLRDNLLC